MSTASGPLTTRHRPGDIVPLALSNVKVYKGAAAAILLGTGYGIPLVPTNVSQRFVGVFGETYDNTAGSAGGYFTEIIRSGCVAFSQAGTTITAAHLGRNVHFSDDNTVTLTSGTTWAGTIAAVDSAGNVWVDITLAVKESSFGSNNLLTAATGGSTLTLHQATTVLCNGTAASTITLSAPTSGVDDGTRVTIINNNSFANVIALTNISDGGTTSSSATMAAHPGCALNLVAVSGSWCVLSSNAITFS